MPTVPVPFTAAAKPDRYGPTSRGLDDMRHAVLKV